MDTFRAKVSVFIRHITHQKFLSIIGIGIVVMAVPLTVYVGQQQQDIRQRASTTTCPNLVQNGSFENPTVVNATTQNQWQLYGAKAVSNVATTENIPGWDPRAPNAPYQVEVHHGLWGNPADGSQSVEVDISSVISLTQSLPTRVGEQYQIKFFYSPRPDFNGAQKLGVYWNGQQVGTIDGTTHGTTLNWQEKTFTVTGAGTASKLGFGASADSNGGAGNLLDNVSVKQTTGECGPATPTPLPATATPIQPTPTRTPSPTPSGVPTSVPSLTPTISPSPKKTPTPTPFTTPNPSTTPFPTNTPTLTPSPTPKPGSLQFALQVSLTGIGQPSGTANPKHTQRDTTLTLTDTNNKTITKQGAIIYQSNSGNFTGTIELNEKIPEGNYTIKIQTPQFLRKQYAGIISIPSSGTVTLPSVTLLSGDTNMDNKVGIEDFNILTSCFGIKINTASCTQLKINGVAGKDAADLNDDGTVDGFDYNLFIRSLATKDGD